MRRGGLGGEGKDGLWPSEVVPIRMYLTRLIRVSDMGIHVCDQNGLNRGSAPYASPYQFNHVASNVTVRY